MKIPTIVKEDVTYYILVSWLVSSVYGETVNRAYKTLEGAKTATLTVRVTAERVSGVSFPSATLELPINATKPMSAA